MSFIISIVVWAVIIAIITGIMKKSPSTDTEGDDGDGEDWAEDLRTPKNAAPSAPQTAKPAQPTRTVYAPPPRTATAAPPNRAAAPKQRAARAEDPEWLSTLADQKRRETAKAAAKAAERQGDESDASYALNGLRESPASPFAVSVGQARNGFVMAEILGPPVSMR